jgi:hypothetical protein
VTAHQERESTEHAPLGDAALTAHELPDPVGEVLVVGHRVSVPTRWDGRRAKGRKG